MKLLDTQRHLFDVPTDVAYFNCAANSPQLIESTVRLVEGARMKGHPWQRTQDSFFGDAETIRNLCSEIFGGDADGFAITPAASYGTRHRTQPSIGR